MDVKRSSFSPNPAIDETVYSWLLRYHMMSGNAALKRNMKTWLGLGYTRPSNEFPAFLPVVSQAMQYPLALIIKRMTPYRYYAPFLTDNEQHLLWQRLATGNTAVLQSQLGNVAGRITPGRTLFYCPDCVQEDIDRCGYPYWHLSHQLSGVISCHRHKTRLHGVPRTGFEVPVPTVPALQRNVPRHALRLTAFAVRFMTADSLSMTDSFAEHYRERLHEQQLLTPQRRIRMKSLRYLLWDNLKTLTRYDEVYRRLAALFHRHCYPECLFYRPEHHHPLKHLLLMTTLYDDFDDFKTAVTTSLEIEKQTMGVMGDIHRCQLTAAARHYLKHGESLRSVSVDEGLSVTTLKVLAQREGIPLDLRPQKIFPFDERAMLMQLFKGESCRMIAKKYGVSVGAVEIILRKHPDLVRIRKAMRFNASQYQHRRALKQCIAKYPALHRQQLRDKVRASYYWLYKHDKAWLYSMLPQRQAYQFWPRK